MLSAEFSRPYAVMKLDSTDHATHSDHQNIHSLMVPGPFDPRIFHCSKDARNHKGKGFLFNHLTLSGFWLFVYRLLTMSMRLP